MSWRGKKQSKVQQVVTKSCTIMAAFERQKRTKNCPVCQVDIPFALYRSHLDSCEIKLNDSECEVLTVMTAAECRALRAGPSIVLDDDVDDVPISDHPNDAPISDHPKMDTSASKPSNRRRSKRLNTNLMDVVPIENNDDKLDQPQTAHKEESSPKKAKVEEQQELIVVESITRIKRSQQCSSPLLQNASKLRARKEVVLHPPVDQNDTITAEEVVRKIEEVLLTSPSKPPASSDGTVSFRDLGRIPYIVKFTLIIMRRVLLTPKNDGSRYNESFWRIGMTTFRRFVELSSSARELFMKFHLRKSWWLTLEKIKERYAEISSEMSVPLAELVKNFFFEDERSLKSLDEALKIAPAPVLRIVAKKYQLDTTKGKLELAAALMAFAAKQKGLFGQVGGVAGAMLKTIKRELGPCYRVNPSASAMFKALFTLYAPSEMCSTLAIDQPTINTSQNLLYTLLRMDQGVVNFPAPNPCSEILSVFDNEDELLRYVQAKDLEIELIGYLSSNKFNEAYECAYSAREMLTSFCEESRLKAAQLPVFLRRFTAFAVLVRCVAHGAGALERQKKYAIAISWQRFLLKTPELKPFCQSHRGALWDRLALNLDAHMKERQEALQEIEEGLRDDVVADKEKLMLQDRAIRISNRDFVERIVLTQPTKKEIYGTTLSKDLGDARVNRFITRDVDNHTVECSVEEVVRIHYLANEGFTDGVHAEGSIWHTVLGLLFYDIIFDHNVKDVWLCEMQANPADLNSKCLYSNRREKFDERFSWLLSASDEEISEAVRITWVAQHSIETSEINWDLFQDFGDFLQFFFCCPRAGLLAVLRRVITDYRNCRSGFPDLTMWNTATKTVAVVEVKGPGDKLSTKQRLWLDFFTRNDIRAEVCHVVAKNERDLT
ncbi:hypothetical protein Q1695_002746 [Nippostrongylus brasiliensis]|nr:hypothetical protein Q1695_002746 [Nippostrongylus brasiliensis]